MKNKRKSIRMRMRVLYLPCILAMLLFVPTGAYAESRGDIASGQSNDIFWRIDAEGHLTISGTGNFVDEFYYGYAPWCDYTDQIKTATVNVTGMTDAFCMFDNCVLLTEIDLSSFDTSQITNMAYMFYACNALTSLDLSNFDTFNVTNMANMFGNCSVLTSLNLGCFGTSKVTDMSHMFSGCSALTSLDISNFNTSNVAGGTYSDEGMSHMFSGCSALTSLDISSFDTSKITNLKTPLKQNRDKICKCVLLQSGQILLSNRLKLL